MAIITELEVQADLAAQGVPDADLLARAAADLNLDDADISDGMGNYDAAKIRQLMEVLLHIKKVNDGTDS